MLSASGQKNVALHRTRPLTNSTQPEMTSQPDSGASVSQSKNGPLLHEDCPVREKRVQFADMKGLSLENVIHFDTSDPADVDAASSGPYGNLLNQELRSRRDVTDAVTLPSLETVFKTQEHTSEKHLALERVTITASEVKGMIRVMHKHPIKEVGIRYSLNNWVTFADRPAELKKREKNSQWKMFEFILDVSTCSDQQRSLHFAVYCQTEKCEYWDNNDGENYTFRIHNA